MERLGLLGFCVEEIHGMSEPAFPHEMPASLIALTPHFCVFNPQYALSRIRQSTRKGIERARAENFWRGTVESCTITVRLFLCVI